jgi:hypothetical protein
MLTEVAWSFMTENVNAEMMTIQRVDANSGVRTIPTSSASGLPLAQPKITTRRHGST